MQHLRLPPGFQHRRKKKDVPSSYLKTPRKSHLLQEGLRPPHHIKRPSLVVSSVPVIVHPAQLPKVLAVGRGVFLSATGCPPAIARAWPPSHTRAHCSLPSAPAKTPKHTLLWSSSPMVTFQLLCSGIIFKQRLNRDFLQIQSEPESSIVFNPFINERSQHVRGKIQKATGHGPARHSATNLQREANVVWTQSAHRPSTVRLRVRGQDLRTAVFYN